MSRPAAIQFPSKGKQRETASNAEIAALRADLARLEEFIAIADEWFWETDIDHRFVFVSNRMEAITGVSKTVFLGKRRDELSPEPEADYLQKHLGDLKAERPIEDFVYQGQTPLGRRWYRINGRPFYDEQNRFQGYRGTGTDITEIVESEQRAEEVQSQLDLTLKSTNEGVALYDMDDRLVFANDRFYAFFDPNREVALPGRTFPEVMQEFVDLQRVLTEPGERDAWLTDRVAGHAAGSFSADVETDSGRWFSISEHKIAGIGTIGVYAEITERIQRERELQEQSRLLGSIFDNVRQGLCILDNEMTVMMVNARFRELLDMPEDLLVAGANYERVFAFNRDRGEYQETNQLQQVSSSMERIRRREAHTYERRRSNGTVMDIEITPLPHGGIIIAISDVTERDRILAAMEEREQRYRHIVENSPDAILIHRKNRVIFSNPRCAHVFGAPSHQDMIGKKATSFIYPEDHGTINQDVIEMLNEGIGSQRGSRTYRGQRMDGDTFEMETESSVIVFDGEPAVQVIARDVTRRRQEEEALLRAKDEAELANRAKSEFLANMSHELRTPLNAVIGFSEILQSELFGPLGNDRYRDYANDIHDSGAHLLQVINDILDLSKAEAGQVELNETVFPVTRPLASALRLVSDAADAKQLSLTFHEGGEDIRLFADERLVKQIVLNLLSNAVKFTDENGRVELHNTFRGDDLVISVRDTGIGMAENQIEKMFEVFSQANTGLSRKYEGTGLGLPLSRSLAELHNGRIKIESNPGQGTVASLILPGDRIVDQ